MKLSDLNLNRFLKRDYTDPSTLDTTEKAVNQNIVDNNIVSGNAANDINTGTTPLNSDKITTDIANRGWLQTCLFSTTSNNQVNWGSGTFKTSDGVVYNISSGNTGSMSAFTYIYLDINISTTTYQTTTNGSNAVGSGKVMVCVAENGTTEPTYTVLQGGGRKIIASDIVAGSITANEISSSYIYAGTISANQITAGTITGSTLQTAISGQRVIISQATNDVVFYNSSGVYTGQIFANSSNLYIGSSSSILISASNDAFLSGGTSAGLVISGSNYFYALSSTGKNYSKSIIPIANLSYDLGSSSDYWNNLYVSSINALSLSVSGYSQSGYNTGDETTASISSILNSLGGLNNVTLNVRRVNSSGTDSGWYSLYFNYGLLQSATINY